MKMLRLLSIAFLGLMISSCEELDDAISASGLSNEEVIEGLKSALTVGTDTSVTVLSAVDGFYKDEIVKILLPEEAQPIVKNISKVPGGTALLNAALLSINRSAEDASQAATPIFRDAILDITIEDGFDILNGEDTAATHYLKLKTFEQLYASFEPTIGASLNKKLINNTSAESAYSSLINAYNKASLGGILWNEINTNSLTEHTTNKALVGLFYKVGEEEGKIRNNIEHRVNEILKKVFSEE